MEQTGREVFLREFIRTVVKQIPVKPEWTEKSYLINLPKRINLAQNSAPIIQKQIKAMPPNIHQVRRPVQNIPMHKMAPQAKQTAPAKPAVLTAPFQTEKDLTPLLPKSGSKIVPILNDPTVIGIECPGADKNVLVNKSGRIQPSQVKLSADEIKSILDEVSADTKIPVISGIFKAVYKSLIVTAVISEFVGSRFIMEKRRKSPETAIKR